MIIGKINCVWYHEKPETHTIAYGRRAAKVAKALLDKKYHAYGSDTIAVAEAFRTALATALIAEGLEPRDFTFKFFYEEAETPIFMGSYHHASGTYSCSIN